jgi:hypothetical protein
MNDVGKLVDRLRGNYTVPVNDGAGLLDGKETFTLTFDAPSIQREAADRIEKLEAALEAALLLHSASPWDEAKKTKWWSYQRDRWINRMTKLEKLIIDYGNASFDCGEHQFTEENMKDGHDEYRLLLNKVRETKAALMDYLKEHYEIKDSLASLPD